jgi:hypothetical protein
VDEVPYIRAISFVSQIANLKLLVCILNPKMWYMFLIALQAENAGEAMHILCCLGDVDMVNKLNGAKVHQLENIMTMTLGAHQLIDALYIWFEPTVCSWLVRLAKVAHFAYDIRTIITHTNYL